MTALAGATLAGGLFLAGQVSGPRIVELSFEQVSSSEAPDEQTIRSIRKVGSLYLVTSHGDYETRLEWLDEIHAKSAAELAGRQACSLFVTPTSQGKLLFGRNFDRPDRNPVLVKSLPPGKYASFAFCPEEVTEHLRNLIAAGASPPQELRNKFLYTLPFYAADGINEKGLVLAIAAAPLRRVKHSEARRPTFVLLFIRRALDTCKNVEEVERLVSTMSLYDKNLDTISHHFLAADADGNWLVIDCPDGVPQFTRGRGDPQFRTNHFLGGGPQSAETRTSFSRYQKLSEGLIGPRSPESESEAMALLRRIRDNTVWSVVYDPTSGRGLVAVRENYRTHYQFGFFESRVPDSGAE